METNDLTAVIVDAAYHLHRELGPGLLESVYEVVLADALRPATADSDARAREEIR